MRCEIFPSKYYALNLAMRCGHLSLLLFTHPSDNDFFDNINLPSNFNLKKKKSIRRMIFVSQMSRDM